VQKGQTVAVLEPLRSQALDPRSHAEAVAAVAAAEAALDAALAKERASVADAYYTGKRFERLKHLYERGSLARDQLDQAEAEAQRSRAIHLSAKASVEIARSEHDRARAAVKNFSNLRGTSDRDARAVHSPVRGNVIRLYRESEGPVNTGEPLLEIGNADSLEIRVEVLSADAVSIRKGTPVFFTRWGGEGILPGAVRVVEPGGFTKISSLGVEEQRVLVICDMTSPPETWRALGDGYRVEANFVIWEGKDVLSVPATALFRAGTGWAVYVVENGRARHRMVEVGQRGRLSTQIVSGLREGEAVVSHPDDAVRDGVKVRARN
jgi:HlyD family secretion protein